MVHEKMKLVRKKSGLNQVDFSKTIDVSVATYSAYETGKQTPRVDVIQRLCETYSVSADWLLGLKPKELQRNSEVLDNLISLKKSGASLLTLNIDYYDSTIHRNNNMKAVMALMNSEELFDVIDNWSNLNLLFERGTMKEEVIETWLNAERQKLNEAMLISFPINSEDALRIAKRISKE